MRVRLTQCLAHAAAYHGDRLAVIDGDRRLTWRQLQDRVARLAGALRALGAGEGDRVAVLAQNGSHFLEAYYAVAWAGCVIVPFNTRLAEPELRFQMQDAGVKILLFGPEFSDTAAALKANLQGGPVLLAFAEADAAGDHHLDALVSGASPLAESLRSGDDLAGIFFTGGTTGLPKGVMLSHENLLAMSRNLVMGLGIGRGCVNLHSAPMFHVSAVGIFFTTMLVGVHVFVPVLDPESILGAIAAHGVTHCFSVPAIIDRMTRVQQANPVDVSSLQLLGYGGSAMPVALMEEARRIFPGVGLAHGYGMTEMPALTGLVQEDHLPGAPVHRLRSVGRPLPEYEMRIVDADGVEVPPGTLGEIVGRGPNVMLGYWNRPEETAAALRDGWMHSQDVGRADEDGYFYVVDRLKDMIVSGAENVYSIEVEDILYRSPQVAECAVIGVPDAKWGERVHAILVLKPGVRFDPDELLGFCRLHIAGYKCPKSFEISEAPLPRTAAGKVQKNILKQQARA